MLCWNSVIHQPGLLLSKVNVVDVIFMEGLYSFSPDYS